MRFKRRSDKEQRPTAFYQPPADGEAVAGTQTGDGAPSATPASAKRNEAENRDAMGSYCGLCGGLSPLLWLPLLSEFI